MLLIGVAALHVTCSSVSDHSGFIVDRKARRSYPAEPYDEHLFERLNCRFGRGTRTRDTVGTGGDVPRPNEAGLKHVIVLMQENRGFDHLFGGLTGVDAEIANTNVNPDGLGGHVQQHPDPHPCGLTPDHEWTSAHIAFDDGAMDGFVTASNPNGGRAMTYYTEQTLPFYYYLAREFAISDRYFSPLMGPTWPNRLFFVKATSCGYAEGSDTNLAVTIECGAKGMNLVKLLADKGRSIKFYDEGGIISVWTGLLISPAVSSIAKFEEDARNDTLPDVSIVGASNGMGRGAVFKLLGLQQPVEDDEHPPSHIQLGEQFSQRIVGAVVNSASWPSSALFITYDENGGYYDHVPPPGACEPEAVADADVRDYRFDRYGFRVPLMLVSPFAKRHFVSHADADHTSITRFIEHWLDLPAMTKRDANAWPLLDMFDFQHPTFATTGLDTVQSRCVDDPAGGCSCTGDSKP